MASRVRLMYTSDIENR